MKILKYLFFLLLIVIVGASVYFGTKDGTFDVAVTKTIHAPVDLLFNQANDYKNWQDWGPWMENDPNIKMNFSEKTQGEGASYSWESEVEGNGAMKTLQVAEKDSILQKITFNTPLGDSESDVYWKFTPVNKGETEITWGMKGEQSFMEKVFMAFQKEPFERMLKGMFNKGLDNMDAIVQEEMKKYTITVEGIKDYGGGYYMFTTAASKTSEIGEKMGAMLGKVSEFMTQNNIQPTGMPFTLYNEWDDSNGTTIFSTAIPVAEKIIVTQGDVLCGFMEPLSALKIVLKGNYVNLAEAYKAGEDYITIHKLVKDPAHKLFEVYANDPGDIPNPAQWETHIYLPVFKDLRVDNNLIEAP
ncbi:MAG: SRPBCC family protein [Flavobacteriaceae bacterium]